MLESPMPAWRQLLLLIGLVAAGFAASMLVSLPLLFAFDLPVDGKVPASASFNPMAIINALATVFMFALPAWWLARTVSQSPAHWLGLRQPFNGQQTMLVVVMAFASLFMSSMLAELNKAIPLTTSLRKFAEAKEEDYATQIMSMLRLNTWPQYFMSLFFIAVVPAVVEELFFRAALQPILHKWLRNPWLAIGLSALVFSLVHFSWYGFIPRLALGMVLGLIFYYSQSIWLSVLLHVVNNAIVVTVLFTMSRRGQLTAASLDENMAGDYVYLVGGLSLMVLIALMREFRKQSLLAFATYREDELND